MCMQVAQHPVPAPRKAGARRQRAGGQGDACYLGHLMGRAVVLAAAQQLGGQVTVLPIELLQDKRRLWAQQLCVGFLNPVSSPLVMSVPRAGKKGHTARPPHLRRGWMRAG